MSELLDSIVSANDIKTIRPKDYDKLAEEIRKFLIQKVSKTGGHLASNLGAVELTMALHLCLSFPEDKLVWDVGHQAYTHKILTGRKEQLYTIRQYNGLSGFPKTQENESDAFDTGHSSTSISVALGLAQARELKNEKNKVFAVIGDGSLSGGLAFEAMNNAARLNSNMVIVLNDNKMSISQNVGGMANYLGMIRSDNRYQNLKDGVESTLKKMPGIGEGLVKKIRRSKDSIKRLIIPGMLFEDFGLTYIGPVDGHNMTELMTAFNSANKLNEAVLVHVVTKKGKGYRLAENNPSIFHGIEPFYSKTGMLREPSLLETYTKVFSDTMMDIGENDDRVTAISAAMPSGTGLAGFQKLFPERFFDVGIAEEHAVTFAAGLAAGGMKPVVAIYSTFLQRAYDQILHDVCIGGYPVVFAIDRSGIVGNDGETHQGIYDISFLSTIPNLTIIAPKNKLEFIQMLNFCIEFDHPIAIRYPRGAVYTGLSEFTEPIQYGKSEVLYQEKDILLLAIGSMVETAEKVRDQLKQDGKSVTLVNVRFIKPFDHEMLVELLKSHHTVVTFEENIVTGGFGQQVASFMQVNGDGNKKCIIIALPEKYIEQGNPELLKLKYGIDADSIAEKLRSELIERTIGCTHSEKGISGV